MSKFQCPACGKQGNIESLKAHFTAKETTGFVDANEVIHVWEQGAPPFPCCNQKTISMAQGHMKKRHKIGTLLKDGQLLHYIEQDATRPLEERRTIIGQWSKKSGKSVQTPSETIERQDHTSGAGELLQRFRSREERLLLMNCKPCHQVSKPRFDVPALPDPYREGPGGSDSDMVMYDEQGPHLEIDRESMDIDHQGSFNPPHRVQIAVERGGPVEPVISDSESHLSYLSTDGPQLRHRSPGRDSMDVDEEGADTVQLGGHRQCRTTSSYEGSESGGESTDEEQDRRRQPVDDGPPVAGCLQPVLLKQWGLAINPDIGILICLTCGYALAADSGSIFSHLGSKHRMKNLKKDPAIQSQVEDCLKAFSFTPVQIARNQPPGKAPIPGITVRKGFYCPLERPDGTPCEYVAGEIGTLDKHSRNKHIGNPQRRSREGLRNYSCDYQSVFSGGDRMFFRVQTGLKDFGGQNPYTIFLTTVGAAQPPCSKPEVIKDDELPSFMRRTRWHIFLEPYRENPKDVINLIRRPTIAGIEGMTMEDGCIERTLCMLPTVAEAWFRRVHTYWTDASDYVQRILANYPMDNEYWKWLEKDSTDDSYATTVIRFVAAGIRSVHRDQARCRLPLTEELKEKARALYQALNTFGKGRDLRPADVPKLLGLFQDFFFFSVTGMVHEAADKRFSTPLQAFMACFGYREDDTFKTPPEVTTMLAHWKFLLRCTALYYAVELSEVDEIRSAFEILQQHCPIHLTEGQVSDFDAIVQLQHLASTLTFNQILAPNTVWNPSLTDVQCSGITVNISKLVHGVQGMLRDLNQKMYKFSGGVPIRLEIPTDRADDMNCMARGDSWLQDSHTEPREQALMHAMVQRNSWNLNAENGKGGLTWNTVACQEFMREVGEIVDLIAALTHIGSGPPVRGEELIRDQITNGIQPRTVYLSFGRLIFIRRHSKDTNARGTDAFNVRYLPQNLSDAICYYLLVIRPLEVVVAQHLYPGGDALQQYNLYLYMKEGKRITSSQFSTGILQRLTAKYIGATLSLSPLRHIMIAFEREFVEECRPPQGFNSIRDILASHSTLTGRRIYARDKGLPEEHTTTQLLDIHDWCKRFHDAIGLGRRTGPLIPLRVKRDLTDRMGSMASMTNSGEAADTATGILKEFGEVVFRAVVAELKPHLSVEVKEAFNEAIEHLMLAGQSLPPTLQQGPSFRRRSQGTPNESLPGSPQGTLNNYQGPSNGAPYGPSHSPEVLTTQSSEPQVQPRPEPTQLAPSLGNGEPHTGMKRGHLEEKEEEGRDPKRRDLGTRATSPVANEGSEPVDLDADIEGVESDGFSPDNIGRSTDEFAIDSTLLRESASGVWDTIYNPATSSNTPALSAPPSQREGVVPTEDKVTDPQQPLAVVRSGRDNNHPIPPPPSRPSGSVHATSRLLGLPPLSSLSTEAEILSVVQQLLCNDEIAFKSRQQRKLIESVIARKHTLAILPTGGGKSMAYEVPAASVGQLTIAAFPFKVLVAEAKEKCSQRGLAVEQWTSDSTRLNIAQVRLVVMAIETLLCAKILNWIRDNHTKICGIIIDEVHVVINSMGFRPVMKLISSLMSLKVAVTFMSATVPPHLERVYESELSLPVGYSKIRQPTYRPEHQYILFTTIQHTLLDVTAAFIHCSSQLLQDTQRAILFVRSISFGYSIQKIFPGLAFVHSEVKEDKERSEMISKWKAGESGGWIIGTTSLIQGIDYHDVHLVVFAAAPFGLIDFVQGAGRAGRNGKAAKIVMLYDKTTIPCSPGDTNDVGCKKQLAQWLRDKRCRRLGISECMDGEGKFCRALHGAILCDICNPHHDLDSIWGQAMNLRIENLSDGPQPHLTSGTSVDRPGPAAPLPVIPLRPRLAPPSVLVNSANELRLLQARLDNASRCIDLLITFSPSCGICNAESEGKKRTKQNHSKWGQCDLRNRGIWGDFYDWNKPRTQGSLKGSWCYHNTFGTPWCYRCALPHRALKDRGFGHEVEKCPWSDIITGVAWSVWHNDKLFKSMKKALTCEVESGTFASTIEHRLKWVSWLRDPNRNGDGFNLHDLWLWYGANVLKHR